MQKFLMTTHLPPELRKQLTELIPQTNWRPKTLYSCFGLLEWAIINNKKINDYVTWRSCEFLGNKIKDWIDSDEKRKAVYEKECAMHCDPFMEKNPDRFFT